MSVADCGKKLGYMARSLDRRRENMQTLQRKSPCNSKISAAVVPLL